MIEWLRAFFRPPRRGVLLITLALVMFYFLMMLVSGGLRQGNSQVGADFRTCLIATILWLLFFAQFSLPVRRMPERFLAFTRLVLHAINRHGPAIFVEDGEIRNHTPLDEIPGDEDAEPTLEEERSLVQPQLSRNPLPGVVILDAASSTMLRTPVEYTRPAGPGIVFTRKFEYPDGTADLHLQLRIIGPGEYEDPFASVEEDEGESIAMKSSQQAIQQRRLETRGISRDGIEVVPHITVLFRLKQPEGWQEEDYGYDPESTRLAIIGRTIRISGQFNREGGEGEEHIDWRHLPAILAAEIWRDCIGRFTLQQLFPTNTPEPGADPTGLPLIQRVLCERLMQPTATQLDQFGGISGTVQSREYSMLANRGLKVTSAFISYIHLPPEVEKQHLERWQAGWLTRERVLKDVIQRKRNLIAERARLTARIDFVNAISGALSEPPDSATPPSGRLVLSQLIHGNLSLIQRTPQLATRMVEEMRQIYEILQWIEKGDA